MWLSLMADSSQVPLRASIFDSMTFRRARLFVGAALLAACSAAPPVLAPPPGRLPDVRGTWTGTWGGAPMTLMILDQTDAAPVDGVSVGPWQLFGRNLPGVSGVLTVKIRSEMVSTNVQGRLGLANGRLALELTPATANGGWISLTTVDENRMSGTGTSQMSWEPRGPVELVRQPAGPPPA
jgi:hypothetical protein